MAGWENYYVIVGSAAAALVGIQFVVITLIFSRRMQISADSIGAFGTPTIVHLCGSLLISTVMSAPWPSPFAMSVALALCGLGGMVYVAVAMRRAQRQTVYQPVLEDWIWYTLLPLTAYAALALSAILLHAVGRTAMFTTAAVALGLLLICIHNSWDTVTHILITSAHHNSQKTHDPVRPPETPPKEADMEIRRAGSQPSARGPADYFTGSVRIDPLFQAPDPARAAGASVTFEPGARTAWHTHPLGQTLVVTGGAGLAQRWGGPIQELRPGDVVWFAPGEKHWHGASPTSSLTHIAVQERLEGRTVDWLEQVTDEQYSGL